MTSTRPFRKRNPILFKILQKITVFESILPKPFESIIQFPSNDIRHLIDVSVSAVHFRCREVPGQLPRPNLNLMEAYLINLNECVSWSKFVCLQPRVTTWVLLGINGDTNVPSLKRAWNYSTNLFWKLHDKKRSSLIDTNLKLALLRPSAVQKSFSYQGARLWNSLSREARAAASLSAFKRLSKSDVDTLSQS